MPVVGPPIQPPATQPPGAGGGGGATLNILTGVVTLDTTDAKTTTQEVGTMFEDCAVVAYYEKDRERYLMGVCSPGGFNGLSAAVVQLAEPTEIIVVDWTVSRMGAQPICPDPTPPVSYVVLLDDHWQPTQIELAGADVRFQTYRCSGTFYYANLKPQDRTNLDVVFPLAPWLQNVFPRGLPNSFLTRTIAQNVLGPVGPGIALTAAQLFQQQRGA